MSHIFPPESLVYRALELTPIERVRVVILGQDPYHGPGQANGLAFSVNKGVRLPPSLQNIYKEIERDLNTKKDFTNGDLELWATQGVLLLNSALTVEEGKPGSHKAKWERATDHIIKKVSDQASHVVFMLWGAFAQSKKPLIDASKHLILEAPHPSPLSAHRGFLGCAHFSKCNAYLETHNLKPIEW